MCVCFGILDDELLWIKLGLVLFDGVILFDVFVVVKFVMKLFFEVFDVLDVIDCIGMFVDVVVGVLCVVCIDIFCIKVWVWFWCCVVWL